MNRTISILILLFFCVLFRVAQGQALRTGGVDVRLVSDEADAVLAILAKRKNQQPITDADWNRVLQSEGYIRLKQRESSLGRPFEDSEFRTFVLSQDLLKRENLLADTVGRWKRADVTRSAKLALSYLPTRTLIRAKIYPVIKPRDNSFVFDIKNDPAIFLYVDPTVSVPKFENTLAHELHHIGYGGSCPSKATADEIANLPKTVQTALRWIGAFGEGFAMLAAAGGRNVHPHVVSDATERARWDQDLANFNQDLKKLEAFFLEILQGKLADDEISKRGFEFFGVQGPWYTVGWKMAVTIEQTYGRPKLLECICDQRKLLATYNQAAARQNRRSTSQLAQWSTQLISRLDHQR